MLGGGVVDVCSELRGSSERGPAPQPSVLPAAAGALGAGALGRSSSNEAHDGVDAGLAGLGALGEGAAGTDGRLGMGGRSGSALAAFTGTLGDGDEASGSVAGAIFSGFKSGDTGLGIETPAFPGDGAPAPLEPRGFESAAARDGFAAHGDDEGAGAVAGWGVGAG